MHKSLNPNVNAIINRKTSKERLEKKNDKPNFDRTRAKRPVYPFKPTRLCLIYYTKPC